MKLRVLSQDYHGNAVILATKPKLRKTLVLMSLQFERIKKADSC